MGLEPAKQTAGGMGDTVLDWLKSCPDGSYVRLTFLDRTRKVPAGAVELMSGGRNAGLLKVMIPAEYGSGDYIAQLTEVRLRGREEKADRPALSLDNALSAAENDMTVLLNAGCRAVRGELVISKRNFFLRGNGRAIREFALRASDQMGSFADALPFVRKPSLTERENREMDNQVIALLESRRKQRMMAAVGA